MATTMQRANPHRPVTAHATTLEGILDAAWEGLLLVEEDGSVFGYNQRFLDLWKETGTEATPSDEETLLDHLERNVDRSEPFKLSEIDDPGRQRDAAKLNMEDGRTLKAASKPLIIDGETVGRAYRLRDITEHQRALERLDRFIRMASHDLSEPLRTLSGHLRLLDENLSPQEDEDIKEPLRYALDSANRMQGMIDQLVTYARASTNERGLDPVDLGEALDEALAMLSSRIEETDARIHARSLPTIEAHHGLLVRLFQNLIDNAIKHNDKPHPWVWVRAEDGDDRIRIMVEDNGPGIPKEEQEAIFEMFYRSSPTAGAPGSGIGLALCREIVTHHGGGIDVDATPGKGSRFLLTLPNGKT